jgi:TrkA domain protein
MTEIRETKLPGVGLRHEFTTRRGDRIAVVSHRSGRRDLVFYGSEDPDLSLMSLSLSEAEGHALSELLGGSRVVEHISNEIQQRVEGLAIDWLDVPGGSPLGGRPLSESRIRTTYGVLIVAVLREEETYSAPGPTFILQAGDTAFVVGPPKGIKQLTALIRGE